MGQSSDNLPAAHTMLLALPLMLLLSLLFIPLPSSTQPTVPIELAVGGLQLINLTADQATFYATLGAIGLAGYFVASSITTVGTAGLGLATTLLTNNNPPATTGRRRRDISPLSIKIDEEYVFSLTTSLEPEECFQLFFCPLATQKLKISSDVEKLQKVVIKQPGKYKEAHKFGMMGTRCSDRYMCSVKIKDIFEVK